jgi:hypothetical protein
MKPHIKTEWAPVEQLNSTAPQGALKCASLLPLYVREIAQSLFHDVGWSEVGVRVRARQVV